MARMLGLLLQNVISMFGIREDRLRHETERWLLRRLMAERRRKAPRSYRTGGAKCAEVNESGERESVEGDRYVRNPFRLSI